MDCCSHMGYKVHAVLFTFVDRLLFMYRIICIPYCSHNYADGLFIMYLIMYMNYCTHIYVDRLLFMNRIK